MSKLPTPALSSAAPRQLSIPIDAARLRGMDPSERRAVLVRLTSLLFGSRPKSVTMTSADLLPAQC